MKIIFLLIMLQTLVAFNACAQKRGPANLSALEPVNPIKDKKEYQGYTIRLLPAMPMPGRMGSYAFDILRDNKPVVHQVQNPLPFFPKGLQKKDDAYKAAQWIIQEYQKTGHWQNVLPPHVAHDLRIETN